MSARDEKNDNETSTDLITDGVHRRNFLKYVGAIFAAAALPEAVSSCGSPPGVTEGQLGETQSLVDLTSTPMVWVTRKEDGLSLGFQFFNIGADPSGLNLALTSHASPGSAYIAVTFPPQHLMEDAISPAAHNAPPAFPLGARASGTSRIVFNVPNNYGVAADAGGVGTFPYTLDGVLGLCAVSSPVVAANAMTTAGTSSRILGPATSLSLAEDPEHASLSRAKIDRRIARVDHDAALRHHRRVARAAIARNPALALAPSGLLPKPITTQGFTPAAPGSGETSIELPLRLLMSPDQNMGWALMPSPVVAPMDGPAAGRTEQWHTRMAWRHPGTLLADPTLPAPLTVRALYARDDNTDQKDYTQFASPTWQDRLNIVSASSVSAPLVVQRLMLSPIGGTIDLSASFANSPISIWNQSTVLGRDEAVMTVRPGFLLPFGQPATITTITKRNTDPNFVLSDGSIAKVGVLYSETFLVVGQALMSWASAQNKSDYFTFPFRAVELTQTKAPCHRIVSGADFVMDPTNANQLKFGAVGTDWKGGQIHFATPIMFCPLGIAAADLRAALTKWNTNSPTSVVQRPATGTRANPGPPVPVTVGYGPFDMQGQRIAFAAPPDGAANGSNPTTASSYSTDSTSFQTQSFYIYLTPPSSGTVSPQSVVPVAKNIALTVEAIKHLQSTPTGGTPLADGTYDYDEQVFAKSGFNTPGQNLHEIFLTISDPISGYIPTMDFNKDGSKSGGLVTPALSAHALSRSAGPMSGSVTPAGVSSTAATAPLYNGHFDPSDFFGDLNPQLFGFVPLKGIIQSVASGVGDLASKYMPKSVTQTLSSAESFLQKAIEIYNLLKSVAGSESGDGTANQILTQISGDLNALSQLAQGVVPAGGINVGGTNFVEGAPLTNAEMQAAAWLQSAATQAQDLINSYLTQLKTIATDGEAVVAAITGLDWETLLAAEGPTAPKGSILVFLAAIEGLLKSVGDLTTSSTDPQTAAGAVMSYFGPLINPIQKALGEINTFLQSAEGAIDELRTALHALSQGLEMAKNLSVEFKWQPKIFGAEFMNAIAFIPSSDQALCLDIKVSAHATNSAPAGASVTCRLDTFAIAFGNGLPKNGTPTSITGLSTIPAGGLSQLETNADITLVFDHMQVQMLIGRKPDVDVVFKDIFFGGDLAFVETIKNLIPLDAFSDPPFVKVDAGGIMAGFNLGIPNIAIGMFSIQNINIGASLKIPFVTLGSDPGSGVTFEFDFCTIDNPFVVTVCCLGGGGFFGMTMNMKGLTRVQFGIQVCASLSIDIVVASGSVSIEVGIFLVYNVPGTESGIDPVSHQTEVPGWLIGGYLRLRGELDVCGIITISIELYLQITYDPQSGKCTASGFLSIDVSIFFFSLHAKVSFERKFAGSNGDPTFAQMMIAGGTDSMLDPVAMLDPANAWDPFAEYCMAYAAA